ncbi:hypothetical protein [Streptomyces pilosus]|uniref:hypothetical protein n=1 Tax=Streptomyces pilosus TaxID=28893 RepID=UPI003637283C
MLARLRTLKTILRDAYDKGAMVDDRSRECTEYVRPRVVIPDLAHLKQALAVADDKVTPAPLDGPTPASAPRPAFGRPSYALS